MHKYNLLFDATDIIDSMNSTLSNRSGIFWVAYNVLKHLSYYSLLNIYLFTPLGAISNIQNDFELFISSFPYITELKFTKYYNNIEYHKIVIKNSKNIIIILISYLKILKNIIFKQFNKNFAFLDYFNIYLSPARTIPDLIKNVSKIKSFHILHDCIPLLKNISYHTPIPDNNDWYNIMIKNLNKETYYFCVSNCTKNDFFRLFPYKLDESKLFVSPISTSQNFYPEYNKNKIIKTLKKYNFSLEYDEYYIFSLCSIDPRKNLIFTIKCFIKFIKKHNINNIFFLFGGGHYPQYFDQFKKSFSEFSEYNDKIIYLGYIDDQDVNTLYSNSLFFTFLSEYEGFGIPPLEAMQAGTPLICSNNSSIPEVVGDAAITIKYNDEMACLKAFEDFYFNEKLRDEYISKGLERAKLFSWEKTVKIIYNKIFEILLKNNCINNYNNILCINAFLGIGEKAFLFGNYLKEDCFYWCTSKVKLLLLVGEKLIRGLKITISINNTWFMVNNNKNFILKIIIDKKNVKTFVSSIADIFDIIIDPKLLPKKNNNDIYNIILESNGYFIPLFRQDLYPNSTDIRKLSFMLHYIGEK